MIARSRRTTVVLATVLALFVATVATAFAYWLSSGTGTGTALASTLNPPTAVSGTQTAGTGTVVVSWTASTGTTIPTGYYVVRNDGVTDSAACNTSPSSLTSGVSCNDPNVPLGTYTYKVVAVFHSWTATSDPSLNVAVSQSSQAITFTSSPVNPVYNGTYTVAATGGGSGNAVTFTSATTSVCTVSGVTVSFVGTGSCTINADQAGSTYYSAAPTKQQTFTVGKASQTITFPTVAPGVALGTATVTASASSSLPVFFNSTTPRVCTISGNLVSYLIGGTCTITADQAGNTNFNAAPQVSQDINVSKKSQTITSFTAPTSGTFGGSDTMSGSASSGLTVAFSSNTPSVCTVSGSTVSYIATGTCTVQADQGGDAVYSAAPPVTMSFTVGKASQTITWTNQPSTGLVAQNASLTATAPGGTVTFSSTTTSVCTVSGTTVNFIAAGTCTLNADQAGDANYFAAPTVIDSFTVSKQNQTITFGPLGDKTFGDSPFTVSATASSTLTVAFTSATTSVCTVSGTTVTIVGAGTCTINADQGGDGTYDAAPTVQQSFDVAKADQTITFTSTAPSAAVVGGATYNATATATSGLTVAITSATTSVCTISGSTVTFIGVGTCTLNANQAGNTNYNPAPQVQQSFSVGKGTQTITFTSSQPANATALGATYTATATATSGLPVTITVDASASSVCSISGSTVSFQTGGSCILDANQGGNANWNAANQVQQIFTVNKASQTITFGALAGKTYGDVPFTVSATASSTLTVAFTSATTAVCTVSGTTVTIVGGGTCTINADQGGNATYLAAPQVQQSFTVAKANQTITFSSTAPSNAAVGGSTYTATASSTSGLTVTITSATTAVCTISGSTVTFVTAGTCTLNANQGGDTNYNAATQVQQSFSVAAAPTVTPSAVTLINGGTAGTLDGNDSFTIQYSGQLDATTLCPGQWTSNTGTQSLSGNNNVVVTITDNGNNDLVTVADSQCTGGQLNIGSIATGKNYVTGGPITFKGTGSNAGSVSLTTGGLLTVNFGRNSSGNTINTGITAGQPTYTPASGMKDINGNTLATTAFTDPNSTRF